MLSLGASNDKIILNELHNAIFGSDIVGEVGYLLYLGDKAIGVAKLRVTTEEMHILEVGILEEYRGKGYGDFKSDVAEAVVEHIRPIRERYDQLSQDKAYLVDIYTKGAERANRIAQRTLNKVYKKIGFIK